MFNRNLEKEIITFIDEISIYIYFNPPTVIPANAGIHNQFFGYSLENSKNNNQKTGFPIESGMTFGKDSNCHSKTSHIVIPKSPNCHSRERGNP